jgi:hypothetical protein
MILEAPSLPVDILPFSEGSNVNLTGGPIGSRDAFRRPWFAIAESIVNEISSEIIISVEIDTGAP